MGYILQHAGHIILLSIEMVSGRKPKGFICKNKGYLSGWTKVPQEGPFNVKCCSCEISLILSRYYCMLKSLHKRASKDVSHIAVE